MIEFDSGEASLFLAGIFEWLDGSSIKYCVERNYQGYPERLTGDLDLIVSDHQVEKASEGIITVARGMDWFCYQDHIWEKSGYLGFCKSIFPKRFALTVELFAGARWHGLPYLPAVEVLEQRLRSGITWRPRPSHQAVITSVHHLLYNRHVPEKYRNEIHDLVTEDSESFHSVLSHSLGRKLATSIMNNITAAEWDALVANVQAMKLSLMQRKLLMDPVTTLMTTYMGYRAKRRLPEGVVLLVHDEETSRRNKVCSSLLELADRWHLFVPPVRKIIGDGMVKLDGPILDMVSQILQSGGVAILNCSKRIDILLSLTFPVYRITLRDKQWELQPDKADSANEGVLINGVIESEEIAVAQIWNCVLADRALRRTRLTGSDIQA